MPRRRVMRPACRDGALTPDHAIRLDTELNVSGSITGTRVGLAGVRHVVEQHGGRIDMESTQGATTTFTVQLPLR